MKSIKFANGKEYEIIECYNNGKRYINGETRTCREIVIADDVISLDELKNLLSAESNLSSIDVKMVEDREVDGEMKHFEDTEVLAGFIYADEIKYKFDGEICFIIGQKTEAEDVIDQLLIAMEV